MHLLGFIIKIYYVARLPENQIILTVEFFWVGTKFSQNPHPGSHNSNFQYFISNSMLPGLCPHQIVPG